MTNEEMNEWIALKVTMAKPRTEARAMNSTGTGMALWETDLITRKMVRDFVADNAEYHYVEADIYPNYTTDPAAAMEVFKACCEKMAVNVNVWKSNGKWFANLPQGGISFGEAETLELAICLFAKKLFGKDEQ